ncbi:MAG: glycosyltransferase family 2 protein [Bacteroidetes bacterium]|nr:glycosyltransferase family 2 protein [Bacteroidota bacterium]MBL6944013.1 glycosyltransferase family 2 protein [Bacteroidales bacterium]
MKKTALVILNYNGAKFLKKFLPVVIEHSSMDAEIWVADNCSTDGSVELLGEQFKDVNLIQNETNGGFATGYNMALRQIKTDYYILLNSDIEVCENWIKPVIELMESDANIGACQPKIRSYSQKEKFEYAGASGGYIDKYGYPFCRGRIFQSLENDEGQYDENAEVFWATGACMFIRADIFHHLQGFDDDFFAHMEEIDLCWRMKSMGYKVVVCPSSIVYHVGGGTLPVGSARKTYLNFRNNFVLLYKNLPSDKLMSVLIVRMFLDGLAALKFLFQGGFSDFIAVIRAHNYFYRNWKSIKRKRKETVRNAVNKIYEGNIVVEHYLLRKSKYSDLKKPFS